MAPKETDMMAAYSVVFDGLDHLGPGDAAISQRLAERLRPGLPPISRVADFGCGVGASALVLAHTLPTARVLAVDTHAPFIARLQAAAEACGLGNQISAVVGDMADPPPLDGTIGGFDLIWSESSIYVLGRTTAFNCWRPLMNLGGWLVFSDIVWPRTPPKRGAEASAFWAKAYPDMTTAECVLAELTAADFHPLDPVLVNQKAWSNYYEPLRERLRQLTQCRNRPRALTELITELQEEIAMYDRAGDEVALAFFLARRDAGI